MFAAKQAQLLGTQLLGRPAGRRVDSVCIDWLAECPVCSKPMQVSRVAPQSSGSPEAQSFKCDRCSVAITSETVLSSY